MSISRSSQRGGPTEGITFKGPDVPPLSHQAADDEFDGAAIDTTGGRRTGSTAWTAQNLGTSTVSQAHSCLVIQPQTASGDHLRGYSQPVSGTWKRRAKLSMTCVDGEFNVALAVRRSANGKLESFGIRESGDIRLYTWTDENTRNGTANSDTYRPGAWLYVEIEATGTQLIYRISLTGAEGSFMDYTTRNYTDWLGGAPDAIWIAVMIDSGASRAFGACDWFRAAKAGDPRRPARRRILPADSSTGYLPARWTPT